MKKIILFILNMFSGGATRSSDDAAQTPADGSIQTAAGDVIKGVATDAVKTAAGTAVQAAVGGMFSSYLLPVLGSIIALGALTGGGVVLGKYIMKEPTIDNTANVVEKIRKISEFTTACYYEEAVLKNSKVEAGEQNLLMSFANIEADSVFSEVVILAKGRVRAGYDLSKVSADEIKIGGDSISIVLPQPEIFDVIVNPSDYEMYIEEGKWSHEEISALQSEYRDALKASSLESGILEKASKSGKERMELFFKALGFSYVETIVKAN